MAKICGIDEAGRGALAGPLSVAACVLNSEISGLNDSKKLTAKRREELTGKIVIKNKAYKATLKETANYEILALGVQLVQNGKRFNAISSNFFSSKFAKKYNNELKSQLDTLK